MTLQIYLSMHRVDLAEKQLKVLQQVDDDSTLTQLCAAWVYMAKGGAKYQEAAYIFQARPSCQPLKFPHIATKPNPLDGCTWRTSRVHTVGRPTPCVRTHAALGSACGRLR